MDKFKFKFSESKDDGLYGKYKSFIDFVEGCCPQKNPLYPADIFVAGGDVTTIFRMLTEPTNFGGEEEMQKSQYSIDFENQKTFAAVGGFVLAGVFNERIRVFECSVMVRDELIIIGSNGTVTVKIMDPHWEI